MPIAATTTAIETGRGIPVDATRPSGTSGVPATIRADGHRRRDNTDAATDRSEPGAVHLGYRGSDLPLGLRRHRVADGRGRDDVGGREAAQDRVDPRDRLVRDL